MKGSTKASSIDARKWREAQVKAKTGLATKSMDEAVFAGRWEVTEGILRNKVLNQSQETGLDEESQRQNAIITMLIEHDRRLLERKA